MNTNKIIFLSSIYFIMQTTKIVMQRKKFCLGNEMSHQQNIVEANKNFRYTNARKIIFQANNHFINSAKTFFLVNKRILLDQQRNQTKNCVRTIKLFRCANTNNLILQANIYFIRPTKISMKLFCWTNVNKIILLFISDRFLSELLT